MKVLDTRSRNFTKSFAPLEERFSTQDAGIAKKVERIVRDVRKNGDRALFAWTKKLDGIALNKKTARVSAKRLENAGKKLPTELKAAIRTAFNNIKKFHARQVEKSWSIKTGGRAVGQQIRPIKRVGLYVPGGTASYPSSVLMNALPAKVAGVKELVICSPAPACAAKAPLRRDKPGGYTNDAVLYAARLCGVKEFYRVGGAQAVAAMAYGTDTIKKVSKIVGPGNAYVAQAKRSVFGKVDIDMIAGPSEICIVADSTANPAWCAADILSQAEHDERAWAFLITPSNGLINKVAKEVMRQVKSLPRKDIAKKCLAKHYYAVKTRSVSEAIALANRIAPEHLQLVLKNSAARVKEIQNAGAVFVGSYTPEVLGDYLAGPNHVLPTSGSARFFSPLGVYDFIKRTSVINYSKKDFMRVADKCAVFAESEGLTAHARAAKIRST